MKGKRRIVIMLTYAIAVFLCAKAQAGLAGITTQIMLAGIYLSPAVMLHFAINWLWGDETKAIGDDDARTTASPSPKTVTVASNSTSFRTDFQGNGGWLGVRTPDLLGVNW